MHPTLGRNSINGENSVKLLTPLSEGKTPQKIHLEKRRVTESEAAQRVPHFGMLEPDASRQESESLLSCVTEAACLRQPCSSEVRDPDCQGPLWCETEHGVTKTPKEGLAHTSYSPPYFRQDSERTEGFLRRSKSVDVKRQTIPKQDDKSRLPGRLFSPTLMVSPGGSRAGTSRTRKWFLGNESGPGILVSLTVTSLHQACFLYEAGNSWGSPDRTHLAVESPESSYVIGHGSRAKRLSVQCRR